jgi:ADP-ribose pyrophosphatase YjhB (NUDIX family)
MLWRRRVEPFARPFFHTWFGLTRRLTLGVRGLVTDAEGRVLLIEHTYVHGWHLPGGGVERGETCEHALGRELVEEAGVELTERPRLLSIHDHQAGHAGDHVLFYRCQGWRPARATSVGEIHAVGWFAPDALPETTTLSTRARLREALDGAEPDPAW